MIESLCVITTGRKGGGGHQEQFKLNCNSSKRINKGKNVEDKC